VKTSQLQALEVFCFISVLGRHEIDEMLAERERLNIDIQTSLDEQTDAWGIKVKDDSRRFITRNIS
jgi:regulator of protease activity HflC (stomatin/prohibitin superfamily)